MDQTPGIICVEITAPPTNEAARKTLVRLCRKDPRVARHHRTQQRKRPSWESWRRGGRQWHHQMKSPSAVKLTPGTRYSMRGTLDVLRDLASIKRWVKVTPA